MFFGQQVLAAEARIESAERRNMNNDQAQDKYFSEVCSEWLRMKRLCIKQSTYANYYRLMEKHILPSMGHLKLKELTSVKLNEFVFDKMQHGRLDQTGGLSSKTIRDICCIVKSVMLYAQNEYAVLTRPQNVVCPKAEKKEYDILSLEELEKMELACRYLPIWASRCAGVLICMYMGLRLGEVCALKWSDVDLEHEVLYVRRTIQRIYHSPDQGGGKKTEVVIDTPKSSASNRCIPMPKRVVFALSELYEEGCEEEYILTNSRKRMEPRTYQYFFKRFLRKAGIRDVKFHILRHTFASRCVEVGFDVKSLSEILGHADTSITLNYYVHSNLESKRKQMELLNL